MIRAARWAMRLRSSFRALSFAMASIDRDVRARPGHHRSEKLVANFFLRFLTVAERPAATAAFRRDELLIEVVDDAALVAHPGLGIDAQCNHAGRRRERRFGNALQSGSHVPHPDRQCGDAAGLVASERLRLIETDPRDRDERRV